MPIQTLLPSDEYDGDTKIPQDYLDAQAELDRLDSERVKLYYENHILESQLKRRRALDEALVVSSISSSSTNHPQPIKETPSTLNFSTDHLNGELPTNQPELNLEIASETIHILTIFESQQQHLPSPQRASELCTAIIVSEQQQPYSPPQTDSDTPDTNIGKSENQTTTTT